MDIVCPDCAAVYEIDGASLTEQGRKVRCAACGTVWRVFPSAYDPATGEATPPAPEKALVQEIAVDPPSVPVEVPAADAAAASETAPVAVDEQVAEPPESASPPRRAKWAKDKSSSGRSAKGKHRLLTWPAGTIAATLVIVAAGLHQRARVVKYLPQTAGLYAAIGLPVNLRGITINNVGSRLIDDNGVMVLIIDGDLVNATDQNVRLPRLRFAVLGKDRQEIYAWSAQTDQASLKPGEKINFRRRLAAPPADGQDVSVRFVTASDITSGFK
jgi:predicted Zn finger-like uncharacterized protein